MRLTSALALAVAAISCGNSEVPSTSESPADASAAEAGPLAAPFTRDASTGAPARTDASGERPDGPKGSGEADAAAPGDAGEPRDAGREAATAAKPGQCWRSAHCGVGQICQPGAPGGICNGCGATSTCPRGFDTCTPFGACARPCTDDGDCVAGTRCTPSGACALRACATPADCPSTLTCRALGAGGGTTYCQRALCPSGGGCPAGTRCEEPSGAGSGVCVEEGMVFGP